MNEPFTPTTPVGTASFAELSRKWKLALERCEGQVTERDETIRKLTHELHHLKNDYRCALATFKAAVEVAQYELEYVTLNQAKPSV